MRLLSPVDYVRTGGPCCGSGALDRWPLRPEANAPRVPTTTLTVVDLPHTVRGRPLASVDVLGDRYSVGLLGSPQEHVACDSRLQRPLVASRITVS